MNSFKDHPEYITFNNFQWLGYFLGGICPVTLFIIFEMASSQNIISSENESFFFIAALIGATIGILVYKFHLEENLQWLFHSLFAIQALYSFILIHILVLYTGGPETSVFSLSYLYLIAIVGYTYGPGVKLYGAAIILCSSYVINLFIFDGQQHFFQWLLHLKTISISGSGVSSGLVSRSNRMIYLFVFLIQGIVTTYIASKHTNTKYLKNDEKR